ncbi:MAG TPA: hypothetical protein VI306_12940 [Pyrinomonadaceae bacterium]
MQNLDRKLKEYRTAVIDPYHELWKQLAQMLTLKNENNLELRATQAAYDNALTFLRYATERMTIPLPNLTPDGEGGIDIEWERNGRHLALNCGGLGTGNFVAWRGPNDRYEGEPATNELLTQKLNWLKS